MQYFNFFILLPVSKRYLVEDSFYVLWVGSNGITLDEEESHGGEG